MTPGPRVGIFGGTFNPIHMGHLRAAEEVAEAFALERVLFIPSALPPHKRGGACDGVAPAEERLAWVREAIADNPRFAVDDLEVRRSGPSYTVDTLRAIGERCPGGPPVFSIGQDAFAELDSWREPESVLALAHFAVMTRPPVGRGSLADWLPPSMRDEVEIAADGLSARHREAETWIRVVEISALDISASDIRARLRAGRSVRYLIPEPVRRAVLDSGVFA